jgi:opacity protein-like surface antigen
MWLGDVELLARALCRGVPVAVAAWMVAQFPAHADDAAKAFAYQPPSLVSLDVSVDGVYGSRNKPSNAVIIQDTTTGATVLSGGDLPFDDKGGLDARVRLGVGAWALEARYFGGFKWKSSTQATTPAIWNFPTVPPLFGLGVAQTTDDYSSRLHSWEGNLRWRANSHIVLFVGGRWISQREALSVFANFGANAATISWTTDLSAGGPQIGAEARVFGPGTSFNPLGRVFLDLDARIAYLRLHSGQTFSVVQNIGPPFLANGSLEKNTYAYELGAMLGFEVTPNVELRAGYRYFTLQNAIAAPDLVAATDVLNAVINAPTSRLSVSAVTVGLRVLAP